MAAELGKGRSFLKAVLRHWGRIRRLKRPTRVLAGIALCFGGVLWFLPILGMWMLPLGLVVLALEIPLLRPRIDAWVERKERSLGVRDRSEPEE
ncbi:MAG: hypothetical protein J4F97_02430 [Pseudomonadales bacterium]|nr:hypothetical protein [Pseudomonadales bacterium]